MIERLLQVDGDALVFSHGHFSRALAAVWVGLEAGAGCLFALAPASVSILGWEREQRVLSLWNDEVA